MLNGVEVGVIRPFIFDMGATSIKANFEPAVGRPEKNQQMLEKTFGVDHFNWYQNWTIVSEDAKAPGYQQFFDGNGNRLKGKFIDPPAGGLYVKGIAEKEPHLNTAWADSAPWYWDESEPDQKANKGSWTRQNLRTSHYSNSVDQNVKYHSGQDLQFQYEDAPTNPMFNCEWLFKTWLVGLDKNNRAKVWLPGFSFRYKNHDTNLQDPVLKYIGPLGPLAGAAKKAEFDDLLAPFGNNW
jgi:hypothetical protein